MSHHSVSFVCLTFSLTTRDTPQIRPVLLVLQLKKLQNRFLGFRFIIQLESNLFLIQKYDVLLIDTAGRMQNNGTLMRELAKLVTVNSPDLVLFVGEAIVGNDGIDQLSEFNRFVSLMLFCLVFYISLGRTTFSVLFRCLILTSCLNY